MDRITGRKFTRLAITVMAMVMLLAVGKASARAASGGIPGVVANQPGATLLLPYFEANLADLNSNNTIISITNSSATAILGHVIIWTDLSVPVIEFNVYLTGYDLWRMNIGSFLTTGVMDQTASAGQDPTDTISPKGQFSQDINFASCNGNLPNGPIPAGQLTGLQNALIGQASVNYGANMCGGINHGDRIARGYITVDTVNSCTQLFPGDAGYLAAGGTGVVTNQNVLLGDSFLISVKKNRAVAQPLVSLIADATNPATSTSGRYTFYGRYDAWTAVDNREPTSTTFAARYVNAGSPQGLNFMNQSTEAVVWRDSKVNQGPFTCGTTPSWYPLSQEQVVLFDEQEHPQEPTSCTNLPCPKTPGLIPFPGETQRVSFNSSAFPTSFSEGWVYLDLNTTVTAAGSNPPVDPAAAQAWVSVLFNQGAGAGGNNNGASWEMGESATLLDSAESANHFAP